MEKVIATINQANYKTTIVTDTNSIIADEPVINGGKGEGFSPGELLAASLSACTSITLRMYADRKQWPLEKMDVEVLFEKNDETNSSTLTRKIHFTGNLDEEQKKRLMLIADKCPIHKTLSNTITIITSEI